MPFKKTGKDEYVSPSGRHFNGAQVRLWYAGGGKFPGQKQSEAHADGGKVGMMDDKNLPESSNVEDRRPLKGPSHHEDRTTPKEPLPPEVTGYSPLQKDLGLHQMNKAYSGKAASYAAGGPVIGKESEFMKTPDRFRDAQFGRKETQDNFGKGSGRDYQAPPEKGKSLPVIKPRT